MFSNVAISEIKISSLSHLIKPTMAVVHPNSTLEDTAEVIFRTTVACPQVYVVTPDQKYLGCMAIGTAAHHIFRFILNDISSDDLAPAATFALNSKRAGDLLETFSRSVNLNDSLADLINIFRDHRIIEVAVLDNEHRLCGVLNCRAVLNYYFEHKAELLAK